MIENVLSVVTQFAIDEIQLYHKKFDKKILKGEYEKLGSSFVDKYFVPYLDLAIGGGYKTKIDLNRLSEEELNANIKNNNKRYVFRIEHYKSPKMSDAFNHLGEIDEIFVCYISDTSVFSNKKIYCQLILTRLKGEYKIITKRLPKIDFSQERTDGYESINWGKFIAEDYDGYKIENYGQLIESRDLISPEW